MRISESLLAELFTNPLYLHLLLALIAFSAFSLFLKIYFSRKPTAFKYRTKDRFLSPAEHSFFLVLDQLLSDKYRIFAQVRIADVLQPNYSKSSKEKWLALNKITSKHFDYLLCDKHTLSIVAAIELDDKSHQLDDRKERDYFLNNACQSAGLQLIRFPCQASYQLTEVSEKIFNSLNIES